jgi:hypothetical protein
VDRGAGLLALLPQPPLRDAAVSYFKIIIKKRKERERERERERNDHERRVGRERGLS